MMYLFTEFFNEEGQGKISVPKSDDTPVSPTEKLVKKEVRELTENTEKIRKLKKQIEDNPS